MGCGLYPDEHEAAPTVEAASRCAIGCVSVPSCLVLLDDRGRYSAAAGDLDAIGGSPGANGLQIDVGAGGLALGCLPSAGPAGRCEPWGELLAELLGVLVGKIQLPDAAISGPPEMHKWRDLAHVRTLSLST